MSSRNRCPKCRGDVVDGACTECAWTKPVRQSSATPKPDRHRPEACAVCHGDGVTERSLSPLRTEVDGVLQPLQWAHEHCRRPTMALARYCDRLARGEVRHPEPAVEAALRAARDPHATTADRRDLLEFIRSRLRAVGTALPYDPAERLAEAPAAMTGG